MADGIKFDADFSQAFTKKAWLDAYVGKMVVKIVNTASLALQRHIRQDLFQPYPSGTTETTLSTRSGKLKKAVINIPAQRDGDLVHGGVAVGTAYGRVHFGKRGQVTEIRPKSAGALTIPLKGAMDAHGVARGGARDKAIFGNTFLLPGSATKSGNAIICGKLLTVKGSKAGSGKSGIIPLFMLVKSVKVPARIHPEDLREYIQPFLDKSMKDLKNGLSGSTAMEG